MNSDTPDIDGALTGSVLVGDHLKGSVGRFRLEASFDGALFPAGSGTLPRTLAMDVTVGSQAYPGSTSLGPDDLRVKQDNWQEAKGR